MRRMNTDSPQCRGFTLIEVMIAAILVMILAAIAWPSYAGFVVRSKRTEAIAALMELMQNQERLYARRNTYIEFSRDDNSQGWRWHSSTAAERSSHEILARACEGQTLGACVEVVAVPGSAAVDSAYRDPLCGTLTLTSHGLRHPADPSCWR